MHAALLPHLERSATSFIRLAHPPLWLPAPRPLRCSVVITHDEEFVGDLGRSLNEGGGSSSKAQLGTYYRVFREEVRPGVFHSRIERQNFS